MHHITIKDPDVALVPETSTANAWSLILVRWWPSRQSPLSRTNTDAAAEVETSLTHIETPTEGDFRF